MNHQTFWKQFPFGSHLCREPMPLMPEMKRDMEIFKSKGFNLIKLQENWMLDEPSEGAYDFSKYHELIEHAQKLDMGVYLGLTCEQAPNWLWEKYPDCRMIRQDGLPVAYQAQATLPADGKPGPCYDHPGAMAAQLCFIKQLVSELGAHENIVVWNTWQEIGYWGEAFVGDKLCYCENTLRAYRGWLSSIYHNDIQELNSHWNVRYPSFADIVPDRSKKPICIPQNFYFRYFMDNVQTARVLTARYNAIKESDPLGRPIFAHKGSPEVGSGMDWTYARTQDFIGTSNYPAWSSGNPWDDHRQCARVKRHEALLTEMWDNLAYKMDYLRSASKEGAPVWAAEFQGGPISTDFHIGRVPDEADMRRWMLTTIGAGATAISFWVSRAEIMAPETNGFALLDSEGDSSARLEEAGRIGRALQKYPDIFAENNKPRAEAAILIDEWKYQLLKSLSFAPDAYLYDLRGWYKLLWGMGLSCDFVEASRIGDEKTAAYKVIIVPMPLSMSDSLAQGLLVYANAGGNVILEGGCGRLSEAALAARGQMNGVIREALEAKVERFAMVDEPAESVRWSQPEYSWGEYEKSGFLEGCGPLAGIRAKANIFIETYKADNERVCFLWDGKPAGVSRDIGKGKIWLIGTSLGPNATAYVEKDSPAAAEKLLALNGVAKKHEGKLLITERIGKTRRALVITNPEKDAVTEAVIVPEGYKVTDLLGGEMELSEGAAVITVNPLDARALIVEPTQ